MAAQTPAKYVQEGDQIDYTPGADTPAGTVVVLTDLIGINTRLIKANELGALSLFGVFDLPKAGGAGSGMPAGTKVYWDAGALNATKADGGGANKFLGKTVKTTVDADATVRVRLSQ